MVDSGLISVGSHTCSHRRLGEVLPNDILMAELEVSKSAISANTGIEPSLFCYPNGDHCPAAIAAVRDTYNGAVTTASGWNRADDDSYLLRRFSMHQDVSSDRVALLGRINGIG